MTLLLGCIFFCTQFTIKGAYFANIQIFWKVPRAGIINLRIVASVLKKHFDMSDDIVSHEMTNFVCR